MKAQIVTKAEVRAVPEVQGTAIWNRLLYGQDIFRDVLFLTGLLRFTYPLENDGSLQVR